MDEVYREKKRFVEGEFLSMLKECDIGVTGCDYWLNGSLEEFVTVHFDNGFSRKVNVTGDSNKAIVEDVLGRIHP